MTGLSMRGKCAWQVCFCCKWSAADCSHCGSCLPWNFGKKKSFLRWVKVHSWQLGTLPPAASSPVFLQYAIL